MIDQRDKNRTGRPKFSQRKKVCPFCSDKSLKIDYKDVDLLSRYISERAMIAPRRRTGVCAKHERALTEAIKRARHLALLPFTAEHIYKMSKVVLSTQSPTDGAK
jgi:small subunit ribosomal protein S18